MDILICMYMYVNRCNLKVYIYIYLYLEIHREKALILNRAIYGGEVDSLRTSKKQHVFFSKPFLPRVSHVKEALAA